MIEWQQPAFFIELLVILASSLVGVIACRRLRVPDIVAYMLVGAAIGPHALGLVRDGENIRLFSDLGVTFLLFELGLEFSLPKLLKLRRPVFGLGSLQVLLTTAALAGLLYGTGYAPFPALVAAGALALSSTALVVRELRRLKLIHRHHAQLAVGVLIFQDIAAVLLLILVPALGAAGLGPPIHAQIAATLARGLALGTLLLVLARWVLPRIFREVARTESEEVFVLTTLVIVLASGWLTRRLGLSMAFGAFIIGAMLGESEFRHQVEMNVRPFRDLLMGLFFVSLGMRLELPPPGGEWLAVLAGTGLLVACKAVVATLSGLLIGESFGTAGKAGLMLAQAGEFGFALIALATETGLLDPVGNPRLLLVAVGSMALSPWLIRYGFEITEAMARLVGGRRSAREREMDHIPELSNHVILAGYGRVGQMVAGLLRANGIPFIALDVDSEQVRRGRAAGDAVIYGTCGRVELLQRCHIGHARLAILTFKSLKEAQRVVGHIRALGYRLPILVRTQHHGDCVGLVNAGADHVVPEMFEASLFIAAEVLAMLGLERGEIERQIGEERRRHVEMM